MSTATSPASNVICGVHPFPGLRPFHEGEEHYFFGRERQTDTLIDKLRQTRFLAVIGSSGSGKSSLVNCGLITALRGGLMPHAGTSWRIATCRPAGQPIRSLANALAEPGVLFDDFNSGAMGLNDVIDSTLHMSRRGIIDVFELARQKPDTNLLVVVDQFEELFRYRTAGSATKQFAENAKAEATEFIKLLLTAREHVQQRIFIVLTMRSDFLGECAQIDGLAEAINEGQYLVPRMSREERRMAIAKPVEVAGAQMETVLLTRLINDLGDDPDQLSILQHALNRIWARWIELDRREDSLNLSHYSAIGSMKLALSQHAEQAFAELKTERERELCEKLFKALTNKATDHRGLRRPTSLAMLSELTEASIEELRNTIDVFREPGRSFLMPPAGTPLEPHTVIDISHESFMRMWKRLVTWSDEEAESTHIFQRLADTAALHASGQAGLWRDPDLQLALEWRAHNKPNACWASRISSGFEQAMAFLDDSRAANDLEAEEAARRLEKERELERVNAIAKEQQQRLDAQATAVRKQKQVTGLIACGFVVTCGLLFFAQQQKSLAEQKSEELSDQMDRMARVAPVLAGVTQQNQALGNARTAQQMLISTAMNLLLQDNVIDVNRTTDHEFSNQTQYDVQVYKVNVDGYLAEPITVAPGQDATLRGFVNQVWIARELPSFAAMTTGLLNGEDPTVFYFPAGGY
ncbi:MAG: hypothetical protein AB8B63_09350 [Granulosicoccus sp.]